MSNRHNTITSRRLGLMLILSIIALVMAFIIIEVIRLRTARTTMENAAEQALRYAIHGTYNEDRFQLLTEVDYRNGDMDNPLDESIIRVDFVPCVIGDRRGDLTTYYPLPNDEAYRVHVYEGDVESLYATWYDGEDCDPTNDTHQDRRRHIARLLSIIIVGWDEAAGLTDGADPIATALSSDTVEHGVSEAVQLYLSRIWEVPLPASDERGWFDLEICSTRETLHADSETLLHDHTNRFLTVLDDHNIAVPESVTERYAVPYCLLNEIPPEGERVNNAGVRWLDAGAQGDTVTVITRYNHGLVTPLRLLVNFVQLETSYTGVNETFNASNALNAVQGTLPPSLTPTETPIPSATPSESG